MIYVPAEVKPASVFARLYKLLQRYTTDRAPLQAQSAIQFWLDRGFSYRRLSQLVLNLVAFSAFQVGMYLSFNSVNV